jgi:hypothetical protein
MFVVHQRTGAPAVRRQGDKHEKSTKKAKNTTTKTPENSPTAISNTTKTMLR